VICTRFAASLLPPRYEVASIEQRGTHHYDSKRLAVSGAQDLIPRNELVALYRLLYSHSRFRNSKRHLGRVPPSISLPHPRGPNQHNRKSREQDSEYADVFWISMSKSPGKK